MESEGKTSNSFYRAWWLTNRRHLPLLLIIVSGAVLILGGSIVVFDSDGVLDLFSEFEFLMLPVELFLIPWMAINFIFFFQYLLEGKSSPNWKSMTIKSSGALIGAVLGSMVIESIYAFKGIKDDDYLVFGDVQLSPSLSNHIEVGFFALVIGVPIFLWQARRKRLVGRIKEKEQELLRLEGMRTKAQLSALQARINPHFLYNALNSIVSLIRNQPDQAEQMVLNLSEFFRYSLNKEEENMSTVEEELKQIELYLAIEQTRFAKQLKVDLSVGDNTLKQKIPRFLIQPLIENAIKHGTSKVKEGCIKLWIQKEGDELTVAVYDNGPDFPRNFPDGYGLSSTFDKMELLFPERHEIEFVNGVDKHIRIKLKTAE